MTHIDSIPPTSLATTSYFFDLDGTLANIEKLPKQVAIPKNIIQALCHLSDVTNGAMALISGRPIAELDTLSAPLHGPVSGIHGAERRDANNVLHRKILPKSLSALISKELNQTITAFSDCYVEDKGMAFALHYRQDERSKAHILAFAQHFIKRYPQLVLQPGKCIVELKPAGVDKGTAIRTFMHEAPFAGRTPLFIGDDLTDEAGFQQVNALQGISIKVGPGSTIARYHLEDVSQVHQWLKELAKQ
ncbi:MAG: trehalose-6-phosphate phosphatase [Sodalis sp. Fle]|nr:MAG: trehalose-6-phosphate phosphatase [Sodalis sp. Fle]